MEGKVFRTKCVEKNKTHICTKHLSVKPYRFRENSELKIVKIITPLTHCTVDSQYYLSALIFRTGINFFTSSYTTSIGNFGNLRPECLGFPTSKHQFQLSANLQENDT